MVYRIARLVTPSGPKGRRAVYRNIPYLLYSTKKTANEGLARLASYRGRHGAVLVVRRANT